jgi:hypothetical protein
MKSAEEILRAISSVCPEFPDPKCVGCICNADLAAIRAAQIDAAEWMREEAANLADAVAKDYAAYRDHYPQRDGARQAAARIRSIKLPGDGE